MFESYVIKRKIASSNIKITLKREEIEKIWRLQDANTGLQMLDEFYENNPNENKIHLKPNEEMEVGLEIYDKMLNQLTETEIYTNIENTIIKEILKERKDDKNATV